MATTEDPRYEPRYVARHLKQKAPDSNKVLKIGGILAGIIAVLVAGGAATVAFVLSLPLLILFSPVLIPLLIVGGIGIGGLVALVGFLSFVAWTYKYIKGKHPVGSDQVDAAKQSLYNAATQIKTKAGEAVHKVEADM